jgi:hypothetical protein
MTYLLWCVGWIRVPGYSGSFFPFTASSLPSALLLRAVLPKVAPAQIQGRLPLPSLLQTPKGKGEGNKASSVGSLSLGCVFFTSHGRAPLLCCVLMMTSAILWQGGSKRGEKKEETPSSLSSLRGASPASCVSSRDNLGEASSSYSMAFSSCLRCCRSWRTQSKGEISRAFVVRLFS